MAWNGSGTFSRITTSVSPAVGGTTIDVADQNSYTADTAAGINACVAKNGENTATGNMPMGGFKHTGVADGAALTDYASVGQAQSGSLEYAADSAGVADAYVVSPSPAPTAYATGMRITFKVGAGDTNTGASTLDVTGASGLLGAKDIKTNALDDPEAGTLVASGIYTVVYDGAQFQLQGSMEDSDVGFEATSTSGSNGATPAQVAYATEVRDPGSNFASSYYTCPTDGVYQFNAQTTVAALAPTKYLEIFLYVDTGGGDTKWAVGDHTFNPEPSGGADKLTIARISKSGLLSAGDKVSVYADHDDAGAESIQTSSGFNYFDGHRVTRTG